MDVTTENWTDLADRANDQIDVTLLWSPSSGRVKLAVFDSTAGESFEIDIAACDALDAYYHPHAYAARRARRSTAARTDTDLQFLT